MWLVLLGVAAPIGVRRCHSGGCEEAGKAVREAPRALPRAFGSLLQSNRRETSPRSPTGRGARTKGRSPEGACGHRLCCPEGDGTQERSMFCLREPTRGLPAGSQTRGSGVPTFTGCLFISPDHVVKCNHEIRSHGYDFTTRVVDRVQVMPGSFCDLPN